jgi:hypothetical protein
VGVENERVSNPRDEPGDADWLDLGPDPDEGRKPPDPRHRYLWYGGAAGLVVVALLLAQTQHRTDRAAAPAGSPSRTASSSPASSGSFANPTPSVTAPSDELSTAGLPAAPRGDPPTVTRLGRPLLDVPADWELFALGPGVLIRIQLALGRVTSTPAPTPAIDFPPVFVVGSDRVIVASPDDTARYVVRDGKPAADLPVALQGATLILPGPDQRHLWTNQRAGDLNGLALVNLDGKPTGVTIDVPPYGSVQGSDGGGYVLLTSIGGSYHAQPGEVHRITNGTLLASGPTRWLTIECNDKLSCANVVIDHATHARHFLDTPVESANENSGTISPDGKTAALLLPSDGISGNGIKLLDLESGAGKPVNVTPPAPGNSLGPQWAWSPDSRWLFVTDAAGRVIVINRRTARATPLGTQLVPVTALAFRHGAG